MPKISDPDLRVMSAAAYRTQQDSFHAAARLQGQYGTWLVATGTATHAAAIYLTANLPLATVPLATKVPTISEFLIGLLLMLAAGLAAFVNCNLHMELYARWSNALMLVDSDAWPKPDPKLMYRINLTYGLSLEFGILSVLCLPIGAVLLMHSIPS